MSLLLDSHFTGHFPRHFPHAVSCMGSMDFYHPAMLKGWKNTILILLMCFLDADVSGDAWDDISWNTTQVPANNIRATYTQNQWAQAPQPYLVPLTASWLLWACNRQTQLRSSSVPLTHKPLTKPFKWNWGTILPTALSTMFSECQNNPNC